MLDAERLKAKMAEQNLTQAELARRVGVSQQTIGRLVSGESYGSRYLHLIARELLTTPAYLTRETDDEHAETPDLMLSSDERELIDNMRVLAPNDRASFMGLARSLAAAATPPTLHDKQQVYRGQMRES